MRQIVAISYGLIFFLLLACQGGNEPQQQEKKPELTTTLFLVRHAEKQLDAGRNPELTEEGKARAERLKFLLEEAGITQVYSTEFTRTKQTAQPLAEHLHKKVQYYDPKNPAVIEQIASQHPGENILVVGHSNTVPPMANQMLRKRLYESLDENEYNKVFVVSQTGKEPATVYVLQY